ncbi:hypothetical protein EMCG_07271 [[Emmonsia] crescens]|uniref:Uncharacterized protein n=1 Tax=[Emmonsia] crescens TaxID=73230 RepID=A0A0G2J5T9_9EURO|nr:hypothetical protein EMCG_07271 [Emmonsia crescens UAMH 3008]
MCRQRGGWRRLWRTVVGMGIGIGIGIGIGKDAAGSLLFLVPMMKLLILSKTRRAWMLIQSWRRRWRSWRGLSKLRKWTKGKMFIHSPPASILRNIRILDGGSRIEVVLLGARTTITVRSAVRITDVVTIRARNPDPVTGPGFQIMRMQR